MAKVKQKELTKRELVDYAAFGYRKVPHSVHDAKGVRKCYAVCDPVLENDKKLSSLKKKYESLKYTGSANFFDVFFLIIGILVAAFGAILQFEVLAKFGVEGYGKDFIASKLPEGEAFAKIGDFANWIVAGLGGVIAVICAITTGCHDGKKKLIKGAKAARNAVAVKGVLKDAEDYLLAKKYDNKVLMNASERKIYDMEAMVARAINKTKTVEDEFDF